jgi:hypothetical protein
MGYLPPHYVNFLEVFKDKMLTNYYTKAYDVSSHMQTFHTLNKSIVLMDKQNMIKVVGILLHHVILPECLERLKCKMARGKCKWM